MFSILNNTHAMAIFADISISEDLFAYKGKVFVASFKMSHETTTIFAISSNFIRETACICNDKNTLLGEMSQCPKGAIQIICE